MDFTHIRNPKTGPESRWPGEKDIYLSFDHASWRMNVVVVVSISHVVAVIVVSTNSIHLSNTNIRSVMTIQGLRLLLVIRCLLAKLDKPDSHMPYEIQWSSGGISHTGTVGRAEPKASWSRDSAAGGWILAISVPAKGRDAEVHRWTTGSES